MMQVSIVGQNPEAVDLLSSLARADGWQLRSGFVANELQVALAAAGLAVPPAPSVEDACVGTGTATGLVVIAEQDGEQSLRLVRIAVQSGNHVFVLPPRDVSPAWGFELQLIQDEAATTVIPDCGLTWPGTGDLSRIQAQLAASGIRQVAVDVSAVNAADSTWARARQDALCLAAATGIRYSSVLAVDQTAPNGEMIQRTLNLGSSRESELAVPPAVITIRPDSGPPGAAPIRMRFRVTNLQGDEVEIPVPGLGHDGARICEQLIGSPDAARRWMALFTTMLELDAAAVRSLKRRRAIDVHFDSGSERSVFKSQMTAMGCLVLMLMMVGLVSYLIIAQLFDLSPGMLRLLRALWIAPAVLYLLAQLLLPVARDRSARR